jgi:Flp pilus assembly protein TadD
MGAHSTGSLSPALSAPPRRWAAIAALAAGLAYAGALRCGFVIDDLHQIVENDWVTGFRHLPEVFASGVWDFEGRASSYYRPLMYVWYMTIHALAGKTPWVFHLGNLLLHVATTALITLVTARLLDEGTPGPAPGPLVPPASFAAGLLFALHPIHSEPVIWIAGACDVGMTLCSVAAVWLWIGARDPAWGRVAGAAVCALAAALFKEPGLATVVLLPACDLLVRREPMAPRRRLLRYAALGAAPAIYLGLRIHALGGLAPTAGGDPMPAGAWIGSVVVLASRQVTMLLLPARLSFWHVFTPPASLLAREVVIAATIVAFAVAAAWAASRASRPAAFALAILAVPLLPTFHLGALNQGIENVFAERYLYLPSFGFVVLAALAYRAIATRGVRAGRAASAALAIIAALYAAGTARRVPAWRDHLALWSDAVAKAPGSAAARMHFGMALLAAGRAGEGREALRSAGAQQPDLADRELAKAAAFMGRGLHRKAVLAFHAALALVPELPEAHFGLGVAYDALGWTDEAVREYGTTIALAPGHADAHNNLGILEARRGDMSRARVHFEAAVRLRPEDPEFRANLDRARGGR